MCECGQVTIPSDRLEPAGRGCVQARYRNKMTEVGRGIGDGMITPLLLLSASHKDDVDR